MFLSLTSLTLAGKQIDFVTYQGQLQVNKNESAIIYLGDKTGDLAAFCFDNRSTAGRAILSKCKNREQCVFSGQVDWGKSCDIKGNFSASAKIISVKSVKRNPSKNKG